MTHNLNNESIDVQYVINMLSRKTPTRDHTVQHGLRLHHLRSHPRGDDTTEDASAENCAEDSQCDRYCYQLCRCKHGGASSINADAYCIGNKLQRGGRCTNQRTLQEK